MANPQIEDGYTGIANALYEALCLAPISIREMKVMMVVIRYSYGFQDKTAIMTHRFIAEKTGLHRPAVSKTIKHLIKKNMLVVSGDGYKREYGPQKDYDGWDLVAPSPPKIGNKTIPKIGNKTIPKSDNDTENLYQNDTKFGNDLIPPSFKENIKKTRGGKDRVFKFKKCVPLPTDFHLTKDMHEYAVSKSLKPELIDDTFEGFCQYHGAKGSKFVNWHFAWQTWVRNEIKFHPENKVPVDQDKNVQWIPHKEVTIDATELAKRHRS